MTEDQALEEAKKRMETGREAREKRRKRNTDIDEPKHLVSGNFDEIELKRQEKYGDNDE